MDIFLKNYADIVIKIEKQRGDIDGMHLFEILMKNYDIVKSDNYIYLIKRGEK